VLKSFTTVTGVLYVMMVSTRMMLKLSVDSLVIKLQVQLHTPVINTERVVEKFG
jgi:hypothetical protein